MLINDWISIPAQRDTTMIKLVLSNKSDKILKKYMEEHYSKPKGFVGRQIIYKILFGDVLYGYIAGGSATLHLPNRKILKTLNNGVNNIFYHCNKINNKYPLHNFTSLVVAEYRIQIEKDWKNKYKDDVLWHETLVELPRTGDLYLKDNWVCIGKTIGYTCKRISGESTDSYTGKRVWNTKELRPKLVFYKEVT